MRIERLKPLVNDPILWEAFKEYIEHCLSSVHKNLENEISLENIYRLQGSARSYKRLLLLREEVNGPV